MAPLKPWYHGHPRRDSRKNKKRPLRWRTPIQNPKTHGRVPGCKSRQRMVVEKLRGWLLGGSSHVGCEWLITMVIVSPLRIGLFPFQMAFSWLVNGCYWPLTNWDDPPSTRPKFTHRSTNIVGWKMKLLKMYFLLKIFENGDIPASYVSLPKGNGPWKMMLGKLVSFWGLVNFRR